MRVAITGASGLIGRSLVPFLVARGHTPVVLERQGGHAAAPGVQVASWDPTSVDQTVTALEGVDGVVHLAGAGIAEQRWSPARKRLIRDSRVGPTRVLAEAIAQMPSPPRVFVCSSGSSFYGDRGDEPLDETSEKGAGFLADVVEAWEEAAAPARDAGVRVVHLRTGVVLAPDGGALAKMLPPFLAGVGGVIDDGRAWMSWIALDDFLDVVLAALTDERLEGPVNAVAPTPVTNRAFTKALGRVIRRPTLVPIPTFALRALYGEMAEETLLVSARILPAKLTELGHAFHHPDVEGALHHTLGR